MLTLKPLSLADCEQVRLWRNEDISFLRTSRMLTQEEQEDFYADLVCAQHSKCRYLGIHEGLDFVGMGGLVNISWENSHAEISIIIDPLKRRQKIGAKAVSMILAHGFGRLNLHNIYGECYACSPYMAFWEEMIREYQAYDTTLPQRKYWNGKYYDSLYFNFVRPE